MTYVLPLEIDLFESPSCVHNTVLVKFSRLFSPCTTTLPSGLQSESEPGSEFRIVGEEVLFPYYGGWFVPLFAAKRSQAKRRKDVMRKDEKNAKRKDEITPCEKTKKKKKKEKQKENKHRAKRRRRNNAMRKDEMAQFSHHTLLNFLVTQSKKKKKK